MPFEKDLHDEFSFCYHKMDKLVTIMTIICVMAIFPPINFKCDDHNNSMMTHF